MEELQQEDIQEEREELMVGGDGQLIRKNAHFITAPIITRHLDAVIKLSLPPNLSETKFQAEKWPLQLTYDGWRKPSSQWKKWVDRLRPKFQPLWRKVGIFGAIMSSTLNNIRKDFNLVMGLAERWNCSTNTFVFPWGEATVTLEDVMILGGYECVNGLPLVTRLLPDIDDLKKIEEKLKRGRKSRGAERRQVDMWLKNFMDCGSTIEHEAFLSYWLANFVFPASKGAIQDCIFPIAVRLARGMRFAFAPAVLASIYRELRILKNLIVACNDCNPGESKTRRKLEVTLYSPIQLVQLWAWERFQVLEPMSKSISSSIELRAARWDNVNFLFLELEHIRIALDSGKDTFRWRPYAVFLDNWQFPKFYKEKDGWVVVETDMDEEIVSFAQCLRVSELVGIEEETIEVYLPHRVAMQFGLDQDIPVHVARCPDWRNYSSLLSLYIPSRVFEPNITSRYKKWWSQSTFLEKNASNQADCLMEKEPSSAERIQDNNADSNDKMQVLQPPSTPVHTGVSMPEETYDVKAEIGGSVRAFANSNEGEAGNSSLNGGGNEHIFEIAELSQEDRLRELQRRFARIKKFKASNRRP
ncbi:protein MAIN-LIKE 2-like [Rutidosis leptorrhynchoides]|uniref:protein MAIN-LIKE 2-like n=1 Tax=Rutidosis leptorrhynchoides TaxID=125765 RepID=UPI003A9A27E1